MSARRFLAFVMLAGATLAPSESSARYGENPAQHFRCESREGRPQHCRVDTRGGVVLVRQLSRGACIEGHSWGWDHRGVWVTRGCRAEFETGAGRPHWVGPGGAWDDDHWDGSRVTCESHEQRTNFCDIDTRGGVLLVRQFSRAACIEGRSWGWDRRGVWVAQGCRAEFESGRSHGGDRVIRCESRNGRIQYCDIGFVREVRLQRQLSRGQCLEGQSWGWGRHGLWVSHGCRGEFVVW